MTFLGAVATSQHGIDHAGSRIVTYVTWMNSACWAGCVLQGVDCHPC